MNPIESEIAERAHEIWASHGYPRGTELEDWTTASTEFVDCNSLARLSEDRPTASWHLLQALLENSTAVIYVKDVRGRYLLVNARFETLFRVSRAEVEGKTDHDLFPAGQAATLRANDREVIATGRAHEFEEVVQQDDGEHTYISLKFPVAGPSGTPLAVCGISTDITERNRAQRYLLVQHGVTRALAEAGALLDAAPAILRAVCDNLGWDVGLLWVIEPDTYLLRCVSVWHTSAVEVPEFERLSREIALPTGVELPGQVLSGGQPIWIPDVGVAENFPRARAALSDGLHAASGFPVRNSGEMLGVIEFFSRRIAHPELGLTWVLSGIGSQLGQFIERRHAERILHEREREFAVARQIQCGLLPKTAPVIPGFAIAGLSHPAQETGGDYFDFIPQADGSLGIAIGDASGHGIGAALVIAQTRAYLRAWATTDADAGEILTRVNRQLNGDLPDGHFATLFFARLDPVGLSLSYGSAGHWPGYVLDHRGEVRELLESTGLPLGIDPKADFPAVPAVPLQHGDLVLLLTDGILETHTPDGTIFGLERVLQSVREHRNAPPAEIITTLFRAGSAFSAGHQTDDVTAVVIKVGPTV